MSIFGKIKDAIFGHHTSQQTQAQSPQQRPAMPQMQAQAQPQAEPQQQQQSQSAQPAQPAAVQPVDVEAVLTDIAAHKGQQLNWRTSIVDLMKLLDLDPSLQNREELATELGYTGAKDGSAEMNIWLHKAVMQKLEENGGKVPADLKQ